MFHLSHLFKLLAQPLASFRSYLGALIVSPRLLHFGNLQTILTFQLQMNLIDMNHHVLFYSSLKIWSNPSLVLVLNWTTYIHMHECLLARSPFLVKGTVMLCRHHMFQSLIIQKSITVTLLNALWFAWLNR